MPSELYVQVPVNYGDFWTPGPHSGLVEFGRASSSLLNLHLQMVLYSKRQRLDGFIVPGVLRMLARPATAETADRHAGRLVQAGLITPVSGGYDVPAAREWQLVRLGTRDHIPDRVRFRVHERDGWRCGKCGTEDDLSVDHIVPWSKGGTDAESNLQTRCVPCNSSKGARV